MRRLCFVLCLFGFFLYAEEEFTLDPIELSKSTSQIQSPLKSEYVQHAEVSFFPKVNPITGEYVEEEKDFVVAGCEPLSFRRYYGHFSPADARYGRWRVNPEISIFANFQWNKSGLFAAVGEENGAAICLERSDVYDVKGKNVQGYHLSCQSSFAYTNLDELDPHHIFVYFWPENGAEGKSRYLGFVQDGSGRKREFFTQWHKWHKEARVHCKPRNWVARISPSTWIPYQLLVSKETLPNGNVILFTYQKWQDELYWPKPQLISTITAYNHDQSKKLAEIKLDYDKYNWRFDFRTLVKDKSVTYKETVWEVAGYKVSGSNHKETYFEHSRRNNTNIPILLQKATGCDQTIQYAYDSNFFLNRVDRGDGRVFQTEFDPNSHKVTLQKGPYGEIARYVYHIGHTDVIDAENHRTTYHYDYKKRLSAIEKADCFECFAWDDNSRLAYRTVEDVARKIHVLHHFYYDSQGNVIQETLTGDLTGSGKQDLHSIVRTYNEKDPFHLKQSEKDGNKITYFTYKPNTNLLESETVYDNDHLCCSTHYQYDDCAVCVKKTFQDDVCTLITYTTPKQSLPCFGLPETVEEKTLDFQGNEILLSKIVYAYHPSGKIESEAHYDASGKYGYTIYNTYDERDRLIFTQDPYGHKTTFQYDNQNNLICQKGPAVEIRWEYDLENRPIKETHSGLEKRFVYNRVGKVVAATDECGFTTGYGYDALGRIVSTEYSDGGVEQKEYDLFGNVTKEMDPNGNITCKKYNIRNQPTWISYSDGTTEQLRYNLNGTLAEHIDKNGLKTRYTYDIFNHVIKEETPYFTKTATWSALCKLSETDEMGVTTYFTYDRAGRKIAETQEDSKTEYFYDALGRRAIVKKAFTRACQEFDFLDRLLEKRVEDSQGHVTFLEKYTYDPEGNQTQVITCAGITETLYNSHKLPVQITDPEGNSTTFRYSYAQGFTKTSQDPDGVVKIETHDCHKKLKSLQVLNPRGETIQHREFSYDLAGNKVQDLEHIYEGTIPTQSVTTHWEYGPNNRLEKCIESGLKVTSYLYDTCGRLATIVKPDGEQIKHTYDFLSRLQTLISKNIDYAYTYDNKGRLTSVYDALHQTITSRTYDHFGHVIEEKLGNGYLIKYVYDSDGKLIALHLPDGSRAELSYLADQLRQVTYKNLTTHYAYNLHGKPIQISLPSDLGIISFTYDRCLRLKSIDSPYYSAVDFQYDPTGHLLHYQVCDSIGSQSYDFTYDELHQLTSENTCSYAFDSLNNRVYKNERRQVVNCLSQLTHDGETAYVYDANGNLIQAGNIKLDYDALDRLIRVNKSGQIFEYIYDSFNRRITKKTPFETVHYLWQDKNEIGSSQKEVRVLGTGLGAELGATVFLQLKDKIYIPIHDQRGSLVSLIDLKGQSIETIRYTAFGEEITNSQFSPWRFCSKRYDVETQYTYFGRRFYCPTMGRFISPDPKGFLDGPNVYAYVHNSPFSEIDLYGEWGEWLDKTRYWSNRFGRAAFDFGFPCASALYNLPPDAPLWKRGALSFASVAEAALVLAPPLKLGASLTEKTIFHLSKSALTRQTQRNFLRSTEKTIAVAAERKLVPKSTIPANLDLDALSRSGQVMLKNGLSKAGRALDKHSSRAKSVFLKPFGNTVSKNAQGQYYLDDILTNPKSVIQQRYHAKFGEIIEVKIPGEQGARFYKNGDIIGFLEP